MRIIWNKKKTYFKTEYKDEKDLEKAIVEASATLFGEKRFYLDVKRAIGGKKKNIPDGYLLDISGKKPRLYVVENELASHEPLKHVAVQLLEFSLAFEQEPHSVKKVLADAIRESKFSLTCEEYALDHGFNSLDHMLEYLVFESAFAALVVIDEVPERLEAVLTGKFRFGIEVIELARYESEKGQFIYEFQPFLSDVLPVTKKGSQVGSVDLSDLDTIVVPAWPDSLKETFLGESCWYAIRVSGTMRPLIRHIAAYQTSPVSAITHVAPIASLDPIEDSTKVVVRFAESARKIGPIKLGDKVNAPAGPRYANYKRLLKAKNLDDLWLD
ncbi:hypothetical protein J7J84_05940 [bacterium]|nr:hypothetical protein [bacterium]